MESECKGVGGELPKNSVEAHGAVYEFDRYGEVQDVDVVGGLLVDGQCDASR
jgi:hypothetical protein